jgi:chromosome segregation ATPase
MENAIKDLIATQAAQEERIKSAHRRIDEIDRIIDGIHKLASNVESLAMQVKMLTESVEHNIARLEGSLHEHGERIGALESKPAKRWDGIVSQIITLIVAAVFGMVAGKFM